jgi:Na+/proline symporter
LSIPGAVVKDGFTYMQIVMGYFFGYLFIIHVLLPVYYKLSSASIYSYLETRFGFMAYKTGAAYFFISRMIGSAFRLYLVALVFDRFVFGFYGIPFWLTVLITILLIYVYSFRGGIKTIVYTDTLQTTFMLLSVAIAIVFIASEMSWSAGEAIQNLHQSSYFRWFEWDSSQKNYFFKHFFSGMFITIVMTGLDQDMMQKNLTCRNLKEAQKNMYWMSSILIVVNVVFLALGAFLYLYAFDKGVVQTAAEGSRYPVDVFNNAQGVMENTSTDVFFPVIALEHLPLAAGVCFILGLIAAAYSTADSALTALTTSVCVDFLGFKKGDRREKLRMLVHIGVAIVLFGVIVLFREINNDAVINELFKIAGYTYGPLLGLFALGLFTKRIPDNQWVLPVCIAAPVLSYIINVNSETLLKGYKFGFELLLLNGFITFCGLWLISIKKN